MFQRLVTWLSIILYLGLPSTAAFGYVLCQGDDGHVAVETARNGKCTDTEHDEAHSQSPSVRSLPDSHCGPCTDVPLLSSARFQHKLDLTENFTSNLVQLAVGSEIPLPVVQRKHRTHPFSDNALLSQHVLHLKTVILLL